jgi:hypothetical protein
MPWIAPRYRDQYEFAPMPYAPTGNDTGHWALLGQTGWRTTAQIAPGIDGQTLDPAQVVAQGGVPVQISDRVSLDAESGPPEPLRLRASVAPAPPTPWYMQPIVWLGIGALAWAATRKST